MPYIIDEVTRVRDLANQAMGNIDFLDLDEAERIASQFKEEFESIKKMIAMYNVMLYWLTFRVRYEHFTKN